MHSLLRSHGLLSGAPQQIPSGTMIAPALLPDQFLQPAAHDFISVEILLL
jgi:hypothetical protein